MDASYRIVAYDTQYQTGIDALMESIFAEFEETIYAPGSKKMNELAQIPGRSYWVVIHGNVVVGTVGIAMIGNSTAVLKGMMLHKEYRGKEKQLSNRMLGFAEEAARKAGAVHIYLGTMIQMKGAQRFYERNGYVLIEEKDLPADFPANPVDKVFYYKALQLFS